MKNRWFIFLSAVLVACCMVAGSVDWSYAQHDRNIRQRIEHQQERINHGIRSGSLTRKETAKLQEELDDIRRTRATMHEDDGRLSRKEKDLLHNRLDRLDRMIFREKKDFEKR